MKMDEGIKEGDIVDVIAFDGTFLGRGHYQIGSIAVRILTFDDEPIDMAFWKKRLRSALNMRISIDIVDNNNNDTYRLQTH